MITTNDKKKRDLDKTRQALLEAAKELMTSCGTADDVTSRAIASRAGANSAMINYCFGSREALLYEVYKLLLAEAQARNPELARLAQSDLPPKEKLVRLHFSLMKMMIANFNYSQAIAKYVLLNRSEAAGMESLPLAAAHFAGRKSEAELKTIVFELSSLHELAVLRHRELRELTGIDLSDDAALEKFVRENVGRFLD